MRLPYGYYSDYQTLDAARSMLLVHHHPEYVRRLVAFLASKNGVLGVGGGWRKVQPVKDGAAPEGKSFHQNQRYNDGFLGACAVDLVTPSPKGGRHLSPQWSQVPKKGSDEAVKWGLHCNVTGEPWHMQPIEIDGWSSWANNGRPAPKYGYPIPGSTVEPPPPSKLITAAPPPTPFPLKMGGPVDVSRTRWLQQIMNERWDARLTVDGDFGPATRAAVISTIQTELRQSSGSALVKDGVYGSQSANALALFLRPAA